MYESQCHIGLYGSQKSGIDIPIPMELRTYPIDIDVLSHWISLPIRFTLLFKVPYFVTKYYFFNGFACRIVYVKILIH